MDQNNQLKETNSLSIQQEIKKYLAHWKWFLLSVCFLFCLGFLYLKKTSPQYKAISTILIKDNREGRGISELAAFGDLPGLSAGNNDIDDEVDIIKSKTLISRIVSDLNFNIVQTTKKGLRDIELYGDSPVNVTFKIDLEKIKESDNDFGPFKITLKSGNSFSFLDEGLDNINEYKFNEVIDHPYGKLKVTKTNYFQKNMLSKAPIKEINLSISSIERTAMSLRQKLQVSPKSKYSSLLDLSMRTTNKSKAFKFLNALVARYNAEAIGDKNLISKNTINFIDDRLKLISKELNLVENQKTIFKEGKKITDIKAESELFLDQIGNSQKSIIENETQIDLLNYIIDYLNNKEDQFSLLPVNFGLDSGNINQSILSLNNRILERKKILENSTELNPIIQNLTNSIIDTRKSLLEALFNQKNNLLIMKRELNNEKIKLNSKIKAIPRIEKDFRVIERKQTIKENLYLFLLKKREEVSISMAVTAPPAKVVDKAYSSLNPVAPNRKIILLGSIFIGLLIPFVFIYIADIMDTKINTKNDIESLIDGSPVLGELPKIGKKEKDIIGLNDRSSLGESFRLLTTNLNYFSKGKHIDGKALNVFVTSTIKGEGKTFVSYNTCLSLAEAGNKILVIGADIRNPQLHRFEDKVMKEALGLSEFLYDDSIKIGSIINKVNYSSFEIDIIFSGRIPPNPTELLNNGRLEHLLESVSGDYDIVIVDTAPTMLVTDTLLISKLANITLYVIRAGFTDERLLQYPKQLRDQNKINGMAFVLNDVKEDNLGYGTKYGYGYGTEDELPWYKKVFKRG